MNTRRTLGAAGVLLTMACGSAWAASDNPFSNATDDQPAGLQPTATEPAPRPKLKPDVLVNMSRQDCERAVQKVGVASAEYKAGVDVRGNPVASAEYQPGVNSRGEPVAPADVAGTPKLDQLVPDVIGFNLNIDIFDFSNRADLQGLFSNATSTIGRVEYNLETGVMTINGVPLYDPEMDAVVAACLKALGRLP